jgi:uncharacterized protein YndB with AHSA1/START domain
MQKEIKHTWHFNQSPQEVWEYLTKPELIEQWLMKNDFKPVVGHTFQFITRPIPGFNFNGIIDCKVLELVPDKKLSYSWKSGSVKENSILDSVVIWTLEAKDNGTELKLVHSGFRNEDTAIFDIMSDGWFKNVQKIISFLNAK